MKKNILAGIFCIIAFIVISSCGDGGTNPTNNDEILPLKVGNFWIYRNTILDQELPQTYLTRHEIVSEKIVNNEIQFTDKVTLNNTNQVAELVYIKRTDGIYIRYPERDTFQLMLKYPCKIGESGDFNFPYTLKSTNINYSTDAGKFTCYQYLIAYEYIESELLYSPGTGLISNKLYNINILGDKILSAKTELIEYSIK